jgi:hypothetical protein
VTVHSTGITNYGDSALNHITASYGDSALKLR